MIGEGGVESLKKLNYMITFGYKILFLLVGPIFEEGGGGDIVLAKNIGGWLR